MTPGELWRRLRFWLRRDRLSAELEEEMRLHLELRAAGLREQQNLTTAQAAAAAQVRFGNAARFREISRDAWSVRWAEDFGKDVRFALRQLRKAPGFTAVAALSLALGIGANTSIFTLIDAVLLKSLPVRDPSSLVVLGDAKAQGDAVGEGGSFSLYSYDLYQHLQATGAFDGLCALQSWSAPVAVRRAGWSAALPAESKFVSGNYFPVLGVTATLGRALVPSDDSPAAPPVAVVSYRYWKDRLDGNSSAIGSTVEINRVAATIVGVAPPEFYGDELQPDPPVIWLPLSTRLRMDPERALTNPDLHWLYLMGRLAPSVSRPQAQTRLTAALQEWLLSREGATISAERRGEIAKSYIDLTPGGSGITHMQNEASQLLAILWGLSGLVLLITCANLANLLLARAAARRAESAIRLALGAGRGRLIRQSLTESLALALTGGALGLLVALGGSKALLVLAFRGSEFVPIQPAPDWRVLAFAFVLSCGAAILFGLLPAIRMSSGIVSGIRGAGPNIKGAAHGRLGLGNALIVTEVALSLVLLAGAGAFARSLANLSRQHFGFSPEHVLVVSVDPGLARYEYKQLGPLYQQMQERLSALPGVKSASLSFYSPFRGCCWAFSMVVPGRVPGPGESALLNRVSPRYFETLGTQVLAGRVLDEHDTPGSTPVAVVTEGFARYYFPNQNPLGRNFAIGGHNREIEIVGVVNDARYDDPRMSPRPMAFLPLLQVPQGASANGPGEFNSNFIRAIEVRAFGDPARIAGEVRRALAAIDPSLPVLRVDTLSGQIGLALAQDSVVADLAAFFGILALLLTCIGLYGLMAYAVQRRTNEIGVRIALGARRGTVIRMIVREVLLQAAAGALLGIPAAWAAMHLVGGQLYGVTAGDPQFAAAAALVLIVCMSLAGYLPARRAARIDPMQALRQE